MKTKIVLAALLFCLAVIPAKGLCIILSGDYTLVNQTEKAVLIVAGSVSDIQYVQLNNGHIYTDVTITLSKILKGQPNIDEDTVRFRIEGGIGIHPVNGKTVRSFVSDIPTFKVGQELIIFLQRRTWGDGWSFYDGLYPLIHPPYPKISTQEENGEEYKVAQFYLALFRQKYRLKLPVEVAFRLIENAVKAPEDVALLEAEIRPTKDIQRSENQGEQQVESPEFLSMLESKLTEIEAKIRERESASER